MTPSEPIWVGDLGTEAKNDFFYDLAPDFDGFCFQLHAECPILLLLFFFK